MKYDIVIPPPKKNSQKHKSIFEATKWNIGNNSWQYSKYLGNSNLKMSTTKMLLDILSIFTDSSKAGNFWTNFNLQKYRKSLKTKNLSLVIL